MHPRLRHPATVLLCLLAACGGEAGDGGYVPPIDYSKAAGLELSSGSIRYAFEDGAPTPPPTTIDISVTSPEVAGLRLEYPQGVTSSRYLLTSLTGAGDRWKLDVDIDRARAPSSALWSFRIVAFRADGKMVAFREVEVRVEKDFGGLWANSRSVELAASAGGVAPGKSFWVTGRKTYFTATADKPWVTLQQSTHVTPALVTVGADATTLSVGTYTANVTLLNVGITDVVPVTLRVVPP